MEDVIVLRDEMYSRLGKVVKQQQQIIANSCMPSKRIHNHSSKLQPINLYRTISPVFRRVQVKVKRATSSFASVDRSSPFNNYQPVI